jgi:hypothetical protein
MKTNFTIITKKHSFRRALPLLLIVLFIFAALPQEGFARKRGKPPTRDEIAQVWFGWSTDELYFVRLDLNPNGKGLGGFIFHGEKAQTFRIDSWHYEQGRLEIYPIPPEDSSSWVGPLRGSMVGLVMKLTAKGRDWKLSLLLRRETEFEAGWQELKMKMVNGH